MDKTTSPSFTWANFFWRLSIGSNDAFSFDSKSNQQHYMRHLVQLELHPVITSCNDAIDRCNDTTRAAIAEAQADRDNEKVSSIVPYVPYLLPTEQLTCIHHIKARCDQAGRVRPVVKRAESVLQS